MAELACGHDWLERKYPGEGLICILPAGHSNPHLYCRESDLFGQTNNTEVVRVLSRIVQQRNLDIRVPNMNAE